MIMLTIVLKASATTAMAILKLVDDMASADTNAINVMNVKAVSCGEPHERNGIPSPVQPVTASNPFVAQAVESSSMRKRIQAQKAPPSGRNRVVYEVVGPAPMGADINGVPARILKHLTTFAGTGDGMSAKQIEVQLGLKRKSVESALYLLRTLGVVQSIAV